MMKFTFSYPLAVAFLLLTAIALAQTEAPTTENIIQSGGRRYDCKCYPGDRCWPSTQKWKALNDTVGGALKEVIPNWAVCYNTFKGKPTYDAATCAAATANFTLEQWTTEQDILNLWIFWSNNTCLPTTNPASSCTLGYYPEYVIRAKTKADIKAGIDFARNNNVRLIIRNTGHDFMGRSTGYGSLAINTHDFKRVEFIKRYTGPGGYTGGAVTVGAGIQGRELLRLGVQQNPKVTVVTGECPTVGLAGGFIQGGGHGPLASMYGMAADQALSFDVITADGVYRTANARENPDLFWALKGGGPSTFATIVSATMKTFPELKSAGVVFRINQTHTNDTEVFWKGFRAFHNLSPRWVENGMFSYYQLLPNSVNAQPMVAPNKTAAELREIMKPLAEQLESQNIPHELTFYEYSTFFDLYLDLFTDESSGTTMLVGGRLFTKTDIRNNGDGIVDAMRQSLKAGAWGLIGHIIGPGTGAPVVDNAVHPRWRDGASFSITALLQPNNATWAEKQAAQALLTDQVDGPLRAASPNGAAYVNEGNLEEPDWQQAYWGSNYPRLLRLKKKWDPKGVFYARTTPGTEDWEVIDYGTRLCKKV